MTSIRFALACALALVACSRKEAPPVPDVTSSSASTTAATASAPTIATAAPVATDAPITDIDRAVMRGYPKGSPARARLDAEEAAKPKAVACVRCGYGRQCSLFVIGGNYNAPVPEGVTCCEPVDPGNVCETAYGKAPPLHK